MKQHLYEFIFLAGLFGAVYLYGFSFDDFSETELVRLSYLWVAALVFGMHGLIASELNEIVASGQAATIVTPASSLAVMAWTPPPCTR